MLPLIHYNDMFLMAELKEDFGLTHLNLSLWQQNSVSPGILIISIIHCLLFPDLIQHLFILNFLNPLNSAQIIFNLEVVWHLQLQSMLSVKVIDVIKFFCNHSSWFLSNFFLNLCFVSISEVLFDLINKFCLLNCFNSESPSKVDHSFEVVWNLFF